MQKYVLDASIILKWVLGEEREPDHQKALDLLRIWTEGVVELFAPVLWQYEVGNFLGRVLPEEAVEKMDLLLSLNIRHIDLSDRIFRLCFSWMRQKGVSFYDASYLAAALEMRAVLVTADEKFAKKMRGTGQIRILKALDLNS